MKTLERLSDNKIGIWQRCHWKYYLTYHERLVPKEMKDVPPQVGNIFHLLHRQLLTQGITAQTFAQLDDIVQAEYPDNTDERTMIVAEQAAALFAGYLNKWRPNGQDTMLHHVSPEVHMEREIDGVLLYARIDALARTQDERLWRQEIKTTSRYDQPYLDGLRKGRQSGIHHLVLDHVMKEKVHGTIFDLIVKTKIVQYYRNPVKISNRAKDRAMEAVLGTIREIRQGDFFRSYRCFEYNRPCRFLTLCDHPDDVEAREQFYFVREEDK